MGERLTAEQLAEIRGRVEEATPGGIGLTTIELFTEGSGMAVDPLRAKRSLGSQDALLFDHAEQDIRALLAEIEALRHDSEALTELWQALFGDEAPADWQAEIEKMKTARAALEIASEEDGPTWLAAVARANHDEVTRLRAEIALRESQWQEVVGIQSLSNDGIQRHKDAEIERLCQERDAYKSILRDSLEALEDIRPVLRLWKSSDRKGQRIARLPKRIRTTLGQFGEQETSEGGEGVSEAKFDAAPVPMAQPPFQWSSEPPTTEGLYWWRRDGEAQVVEVNHPPRGGSVAYFIGGGWEYVHSIDGEWWPEPLVPPGGEE